MPGRFGRLSDVNLRRHLLPSAPRWEAVLGEWLALIAASGGPGDDLLQEAATDVAETLLTRTAGVGAALGRFGRTVGTIGYSLDDAAVWLQLLVSITPSRAGRLQGFDAGLSLARGWSQGHLGGLQAAAATDPTTGLLTEAVLRIRLEQVYAAAASVRVPVQWTHAIVVVSATVPPTEPFRREATYAVLGDLVQRHWSAGDTAAAIGDRILVLCSNTADLDDRVDAFHALVDRIDLLRTVGVDAWIEALPEHIGPAADLPGGALRVGGQECTQTGVRIGMRSVSQMKSIAGTLTRTHPCEAA